MELVDLVVGIFGTCVGCVPFAAAWVRWRRRRAGTAFEHAVTPILHDLRATFGKRVRAEQRRLLVRDAVRLASLAAYGVDRPFADDASKAYRERRIACGYCGLEVEADREGCCVDCGLGARHWCGDAPPPREIGTRTHLAVMR